MKKVLPLCIKPYISSECWTYYKFAILQTEKTHLNWLMTYMDLWADSDGDSMYGDLNERFKMSAFGEILDIRDGHILSQSKETIINYLIDLINKNQYIVLDVDYTKIFNFDSDFYLHELLIYGYDNKCGCFYCPILDGQVFKEYTIDFSKIVDAFASVLVHYENSVDSLWGRRERFYGITILNPKEYTPKLNYCFDFINKVRDEAIGYFYTRGTVNENLISEGDYKCYTGNTIILLIYMLLNQAINDVLFLKSHKQRIQRLILKALEHQNILSSCMHHFSELFDSQDALSDILDEYDSCCKEMKIIYTLYEKFLITNELQILYRLSEYLYALYYNRWRVLNEFTTRSKDIYMNKCVLGLEYKNIN